MTHLDRTDIAPALGVISLWYGLHLAWAPLGWIWIGAVCLAGAVLLTPPPPVKPEGDA